MAKIKLSVNAALRIHALLVALISDKSLPIQLYFRFPDPLVITLGGLMKLTASAHMKTEIPKMIKIDHVIKRRFLGRWWKIPCMHGGGSW